MNVTISAMPRSIKKNTGWNLKEPRRALLFVFLQIIWVEIYMYISFEQTPYCFWYMYFHGRKTPYGKRHASRIVNSTHLQPILREIFHSRQCFGTSEKTNSTCPSTQIPPIDECDNKYSADLQKNNRSRAADRCCLTLNFGDDNANNAQSDRCQPLKDHG